MNKFLLIASLTVVMVSALGMDSSTECGRALSLHKSIEKEKTRLIHLEDRVYDLGNGLKKEKQRKKKNKTKNQLEGLYSNHYKIKKDIENFVKEKEMYLLPRQELPVAMVSASGMDSSTERRRALSLHKSIEKKRTRLIHLEDRIYDLKNSLKKEKQCKKKKNKTKNQLEGLYSNRCKIKKDLENLEKEKKLYLLLKQESPVAMISALEMDSSTECGLALFLHKNIEKERTRLIHLEDRIYDLKNSLKKEKQCKKKKNKIRNRLRGLYGNYDKMKKDLENLAIEKEVYLGLMEDRIYDLENGLRKEKQWEKKTKIKKQLRRLYSNHYKIKEDLESLAKEKEMYLLLRQESDLSIDTDARVAFGKNYTIHALERMNERIISFYSVENAINNGKKYIDEDNLSKVCYEFDNLKVVTDKDNKTIITTYWNS